jgi:hypothetical protein
MAKYLLVYHGGSMPESEEAQKAALDAWGAWFGALGSAVVDPGNPATATKVISADGSVADGGAASPTGYTVLQAGSHAEAVELAKGCPVLAGGAMIEVVETFEFM